MPTAYIIVKVTAAVNGESDATRIILAIFCFMASPAGELRLTFVAHEENCHRTGAAMTCDDRTDVKQSYVRSWVGFGKFAARFFGGLYAVAVRYPQFAVVLTAVFDVRGNFFEGFVEGFAYAQYFAVSDNFSVVV